MVRQLSWLVLAGAIFAFGSATQSPFAAVAAAAAFAAFSVRLSQERHDFAVVMLPFTLWRWTILGALVAVEFGAYMPEIGRQGRFVNATAAYLVFMMVMYFAAELSFRHSARFLQGVDRRAAATRPDLRLILPAALISVSIAIAFLMVKGAIEGFPLFTQTDRFFFRLQTADYWFGWVMGNAIVFPALLGVCMAYAEQPAARIAAGAATACFLIAMFLFGEKFFSILMIACVFIAPTLLVRGQRQISLGFWALGAFMLVGSLAATWYIYSDYGRNLPGYTLERIMSRVAGQGQLWFAAWGDAQPLQGDQAQWRQMTDTLYPMDGHDLAFERGTNIFYLMRRYATDELWGILQDLRGTVTYTAGTEAYLILTLGIIGGAVATGLLGLYYGAVVSYVAFAMRRPAFLRLFLAAKLLGYTLDGAHQAAFWNIVGTRALTTLAAVAAYEIVMALLRQRGDAQFAPASYARPAARAGPRSPEVR
jgi:hypothetical protein